MCRGGVILKMRVYDSTSDTLDHRAKVIKNVNKVVTELENRALTHDETKLHDPEKSIFDAQSPKLKNLTYGSNEYMQELRKMEVALKHHYSNNRHHPEYHADGISGMNLVDLIEMVCDWKAASERHNDGDIYKSLEINQKRFGYSDELASIIRNTIKFLEEVK